MPIEDVPPLALGSEDKAVAPLQKALAAIGYHIQADGIYGPQTAAVISAFQRRFRPAKIDGTAGAETQTLVYALCRLALSADTPALAFRECRFALKKKKGAAIDLIRFS